MGRLFLLRHAKAAWAEPGTRDFDRPLTPAGHAEAEAVGRAMGAKGLVPSLTVCSPARRAVETWQGIASALGLKPSDAMLSETLYASDAGGYLNIMRNNAGAAALLIVGHNPMIEDLAAAMSARGCDAARATLAKGFPTAGLAVFSLAAGPTGRVGADARLDAFLIPADL